ncbi:MAG: hypothetical protein PUB51_06810 [Oscillospiraceae bacterium]|nr:hypothetical protein [Oscillospiraceae bacterium]
MESGTEQGRSLYELGAGLAGAGRVLVGTAGGFGAQVAGTCIACGAAMSGTEVLFHDGSCAACGVWLAGYYGLKAAVFVREEKGALKLTATDERGRPLSLPVSRSPAGGVGRWDRLWGADSAWAAHRARGAGAPMAVAAEGPGALRLLLERLGCDVVEHPRPDIPLLCSDREGFHLRLYQGGTDRVLPGEDALAAAAAWLGRERAVPAFRHETIR